MALTESTTAREAFVQALASAREGLEPPVPAPRLWPPVAAAAFFALAAMLFATAAVLAPPPQSGPPAGVRGPI